MAHILIKWWIIDWEENLIKIELKLNNFHNKKLIWKYLLQNILGMGSDGLTVCHWLSPYLEWSLVCNSHYEERNEGIQLHIMPNPLQKGTTHMNSTFSLIQNIPVSLCALILCYIFFGWWYFRLTFWDSIMYICFSVVGHYWFRECLVTCAPFY